MHDLMSQRCLDQALFLRFKSFKQGFLKPTRVIFAVTS